MVVGLDSATQEGRLLCLGYMGDTSHGNIVRGEIWNHLIRRRSRRTMEALTCTCGTGFLVCLTVDRTSDDNQHERVVAGSVPNC